MGQQTTWKENLSDVYEPLTPEQEVRMQELWSIPKDQRVSEQTQELYTLYGVEVGLSMRDAVRYAELSKFSLRELNLPQQEEFHKLLKKWNFNKIDKKLEKIVLRYRESIWELLDIENMTVSELRQFFASQKLGNREYKLVDPMSPLDGFDNRDIENIFLTRDGGVENIVVEIGNITEFSLIKFKRLTQEEGEFLLKLIYFIPIELRNQEVRKEICRLYAIETWFDREEVEIISDFLLAPEKDLTEERKILFSTLVN